VEPSVVDGRILFACRAELTVRYTDVASSPGGGMVDAEDSKSFVGNNVWVRVPPRAQMSSIQVLGRRLIERRLRRNAARIRRSREELAVIDAQLPHLDDDAQDLQIRALTSDGSAGDGSAGDGSASTREARQAQAHSDALRAERQRIAALIVKLEGDQDGLLDRLAP
jgi:hypothetical protein